MRREASELAKARRTSEEALRERKDALEPLRTKLAETEAELVQARVDGDRLREHATALADELSALPRVGHGAAGGGARSDLPCRRQRSTMRPRRSARTSSGAGLPPTDRRTRPFRGPAVTRWPS